MVTSKMISTFTKNGGNQRPIKTDSSIHSQGTDLEHLKLNYKS